MQKTSFFNSFVSLLVNKFKQRKMNVTKATILVMVCTQLIVMSRAACPNSCSGHGTCNKYDECTCYTEQRDGAASENFAWKEPDCSARVCPHGVSHIFPARYGDTIYDHKPNAECSDRGFCDRSTGECQCLPGWTGTACQYGTFRVVR